MSLGCQIVELESKVINSRNASLTWKLETSCVSTRYKIYVHLKTKLACYNNSNNNSFQDSFTIYESNVSEIWLTSLEPYSTYSIDIVAILDKEQSPRRSFEITTKAEAPDLHPQSVNVLIGKTKLHFYWRDDEIENCEKRNGIPSGYLVQLFGMSPWVLNTLFINQTLGFHVKEYYAGNLKPFTNYRFLVYSLNENERINERFPLLFFSSTLPTTPSHPQNISSSMLDKSLYITWEPEYPPSGVVEYYYLRVGNINGSFVNGTNLDPKTTKCRHNKRRHCWTLSDDYLSSPFDSYTFQMKTKNINVSLESEYSLEKRLFSYSSNLNTSSSSSSMDKRDESQRDSSLSSETSLVFLICLLTIIFVLLLLLGLLLYKLKVGKLKLESRKINISSSLMTTDWFYKVQRIQSRELPDPPPESLSNKEFLQMDISGYLSPTFTSNTENKDNENKKKSHSGSMIALESYESRLDIQQKLL